MSDPVRDLRNGLLGGLVGWVGFVVFLVWVMPV